MLERGFEYRYNADCRESQASEEEIMANEKSLTVTETKLARIRAELAFSDQLVEKVLESGIDYGLHPGTRSQALKDPGANTLINAFGCYLKAEILYREVNEDRISYVIDIALISRDDGLIKSSGTGSASTRETKYGIRWVENPEAFGYDRASLRKRSQGQGVVYRIINPEWSELENTILKMARKRAEVDAAMALPGVARFMARLNSGKDSHRRAGPPSEDWSGFWTRARDMGLDERQVHEVLGVSSMKEWTGQGKTLSDAIRKISEAISGRSEEANHVEEIH